MSLLQKQLEDLGVEALKRAHEAHERLGNGGLKRVQKNTYGDTSLVGDIEAEKAIIDTFRDANIPLRIISEEHGQVDLSENPQYLAVLDGLDGTNVYVSTKRTGRYGTMFGIFSNLDPTYDDYLFNGVMEHATERLYFASKDKGTFLIEDGQRSLIKCSTRRVLKNARVYINEHFDGAMNSTFFQDTYFSKLDGYPFEYLHNNSTAIHYVDLANGAVDLVLECTRKGNLEIAAAYGLMNEAGGVTVTPDGKSIGNKKYLVFGQDRYVALISASTIELAQELIHKIQ